MDITDELNHVFELKVKIRLFLNSKTLLVKSIKWRISFKF
jgi:hypothetical protein